MSTERRQPLDGMRVLHVIPGKGSGSSFVFSKREADALRRLGVVVETHFLDTSLRARRILGEFVALRRKIRADAPRVVHVHYGTVSAFLTALAIGRIPLVITFRGSDLNPDRSVSPLRSVVSRMLSHVATLRSSFCICVSRQLQERLIFGRHRSIVLPTGVDAEVFRPMDRRLARHELGWDLDKKVIFFNISSGAQVKRLDLAESAHRELLQRGVDAELLILKGDTNPAQIPLYMNACDCLLLTSDWEGSPTVIQEALCCNLPIVSVDVGDVREQIADVEHCQLVDRAPLEIARGLKRVLASGCRSNGVIKRERISLAALAEKILEVYENVASGG